MIQHFRKHVQHAHPELDKWSKQANGQEEDKEEDEAHDRNRQSWLSQPQTSKKAKMYRLPLLAHRSHRKMLAVKKVRLRVQRPLFLHKKHKKKKHSQTAASIPFTKHVHKQCLQVPLHQ